jgi:hypothetical protein
MPWSSKWTLSFWLSHQNLVHFSLLFHMCHMSHQPHSPWFDLSSNIWGWVQNVKLLTLQLPPFSCYFLDILLNTVCMNVMCWCRLNLTVLLVNGLIHEAFQYQRQHCNEQNSRDLLQHFFSGKYSGNFYHCRLQYVLKVFLLQQCYIFLKGSIENTIYYGCINIWNKLRGMKTSDICAQEFHIDVIHMIFILFFSPIFIEQFYLQKYLSLSMENTQNSNVRTSIHTSLHCFHHQHT